MDQSHAVFSSWPIGSAQRRRHAFQTTVHIVTLWPRCWRVQRNIFRKKYCYLHIEAMWTACDANFVTANMLLPHPGDSIAQTRWHNPLSEILATPIICEWEGGVGNSHGVLHYVTLNLKWKMPKHFRHFKNTTGWSKNGTQFYLRDNFGNSAPILTILPLLQAEIYGA